MAKNPYAEFNLKSKNEALLTLLVDLHEVMCKQPNKSREAFVISEAIEVLLIADNMIFDLNYSLNALAEGRAHFIVNDNKVSH